MPATGLLRAIAVLAIGLLAGSVLPADLIARRRGIDIRATGDGNPGTVNAFRVLGAGPGVVTLVYDALVGIAAILIARWLGASQGVAYLAGIAALVGHRFPVFLGFRGGGQGMAASAGMVVYGVGVALAAGWLSPLAVAALVVIGGVTFAFTRSDRAIALTLLPALLVLLALGRADWQLLALEAVVAGNIIAVQIGFLTRRAPAAGAAP